MQSFKLNDNGEYEDIAGKSRDEVLLLHDRMINDQDKHLDTILGVT